MFKDVMRLVSGAGAAQVIGTLASPIITRLYGAEAMGIAALFVAMTGIISAAACLAYEQTIVIADDDRAGANLLVGSMLCAMLVALVSVPIVIFVAPMALQWSGIPELLPFVWLVPVVLIVHGFFLALNYWNTRTKHYTRLSITRVTSQVATTSASLVGGFSGHATPTTLIGAGVGGQGIAVIVLGLQILRDQGKYIAGLLSWQDVKAGLKRYRYFPMLRTPSTLLNSASWQLPVLMLGAFFSPVVVGFYALGFRILQMPMSLIGKAVSQVFLQRASVERGRGTLDTLVADMFRRLLVIALLPSLVLLLIAEQLFSLVFGAQWSEAGVYVQILAPWSAIWFISSPLSSLYYVLEKQREEIFLQGTLFLTRLSAIGLGGVLGEPRLAVALFCLSGILTYGYLLTALFGFVNLTVRRVAVRCWLPVRDACLAIVPVALARILNLHVIALLFISTVVCLLYLYRYRKSLTGHE